jgi:hypothetical protein
MTLKLRQQELQNAQVNENRQECLLTMSRKINVNIDTLEAIRETWSRQMKKVRKEEVI